MKQERIHKILVLGNNDCLETLGVLPKNTILALSKPDLQDVFGLVPEAHQKLA